VELSLDDVQHFGVAETGKKVQCRRDGEVHKRLRGAGKRGVGGDSAPLVVEDDAMVLGLLNSTLNADQGLHFLGDNSAVLSYG
jgi:hypothetical protein